MATSYNPKLVTSGLIMYLDAGNPVSYRGSGATWSDISENNSNGTLVGSPTFSTEKLGCMTFNGSTQYADLSIQWPTNFTIDIVAKTGNNAVKQAVISNYSSANDGGGIEFLANGTMNFFIFLSGGSVGGYTSTSTISSNTIYNLVGTKSGTSFSFYVNGLLLGSTTASTATLLQSQNLRVATDRSTTQTSKLNGSVYSTKLYNRALTATEVSQNFSALRGRFGV